MIFKNTSAIRACNVSKVASSGANYVTILDRINLEVQNGKSLAIVGNSGSGKTTLLTILAGLDTPTFGEVFIGNQCISSLQEDKRASIRKSSVGFVFQSFQLIPELTAVENIALPLEISGASKSESLELANNWINKVGLQNRSNHYPKTLSGGEQQRVALARAFITSPKLLFADEPTGSLDNENADLITELLFKLNRELSCTLILVTHDMNLAMKCDHQLSLKSGKQI